MAYATPEQLADALDIRVTADNAETLDDCLDAAATEIDHYLEGQPITWPPPGAIVRTNINRAVEWFKAPATYNGGVGTADIGVMDAPTLGVGRHAARSGFERHAAALLPFKASWGVA